MGNVMDTAMAESHVTNKITEKGTSKDGTMVYAASGMKGWRQTMEDCHTICTQVKVGEKVLQQHALFAVYDGHGGGFTSQYAGTNFVRIFTERTEMKKYSSLPRTGKKGRDDVNGIELLRDALVDSFRALDNELREEQLVRNREMMKPALPVSEVRVERSGATCVVVLLTPSHILCANAGDSRAILRRNGRVLPLSFDHKPSNLPETDRICDAGGYVRNKRVNGDLAVSRALGDFGFKNEESLLHDEQKVICKPDILVYPREEEGDEFIVLACDGVWDVVENEQCAHVIQEMFDEGEGDVGLVCEEVLDLCLHKNSRDNMTMVMVCLPGAKMERNPFNQRSVVTNRRMTRQAKTMRNDAKVAAQTAMEGVGINVDLGGKTKQSPLFIRGRMRGPRVSIQPARA